MVLHLGLPKEFGMNHITSFYGMKKKSFLQSGSCTLVTKLVIRDINREAAFLC